MSQKKITVKVDPVGGSESTEHRLTVSVGNSEQRYFFNSPEEVRAALIGIQAIAGLFIGEGYSLEIEVPDSLAPASQE